MGSPWGSAVRAGPPRGRSDAGGGAGDRVNLDAPPCASAIEETIDRPRPGPLHPLAHARAGSGRKIRSYTRPECSGGSPGPQSADLDDRLAVADRVHTVTGVPAGVWALGRLPITWRGRGGRRRGSSRARRLPATRRGHRGGIRGVASGLEHAPGTAAQPGEGRDVGPSLGFRASIAGSSGNSPTSSPVSSANDSPVTARALCGATRGEGHGHQADGPSLLGADARPRRPPVTTILTAWKFDFSSPDESAAPHQVPCAE